MHNVSFLAIVALSMLSAACTSYTPEQHTAYVARQERAHQHGHCQVVVCVDSVNPSDTPALFEAPMNNQAPTVIANRSH